MVNYKIYIFFVAYFAFRDHPFGGGEKRMFEVTKRWRYQKKGEMKVLTSVMGYEACTKQGFDVKFRVIPFKIFDKFGIIVAYLVRTILACFLVPKLANNITIYCATDIIPDVIPAVLSKILNRNAKLVCTVFHLIPHHSVRVGSKLNNIISYYAQRISLVFIKIFADIVFIDNVALKRELVKLGFCVNKLTVTSMGIDKEYIDRIPSSYPKYDGCFLGRLHQSKGIFDLIDIWRLVTEKRKDAKLAIVGSGSQVVIDKLNKKIEDYNLRENVLCLGFLQMSEVYKTLKASKVFVFPSHEEGWGISVCESMACGLPVVAYDLPVFREIFSKGMLRINMNDYHAFAENVLELLNNEVKYTKLSRDAANVTLQYNWDEVAARELLYIEGIISK